MFVMPNCIVNPTAEMAMIDMDTRPKPNAATMRLIAAAPDRSVTQPPPAVMMAAVCAWVSVPMVISLPDAS
jgi:hypothetical protein